MTTELSMQPLETTKNWYAQFVQFSQEIMKEKMDYWVIPGVSKPSLFKPWAEKLRLVYGLQAFTEKTTETLDIDRDFYDVNYMVTIKDRNGFVLWMCEGSCNTMEERYNFTAWKDASKPMKDWKQDDIEIERLKAEWLGKRKRGNSGRVWQQREQVKTWKLTHKNTIQKMAQKRAYVGAILNATGASEFFTQDVEDMGIATTSEVIEVKEEKKEEKNQTSTPVSNSEDVRPETTKPRFNEPELKELSEKRLFVSSFTTAQDLLNAIKKDYMVSRVMTDKLCELWESCLGEQGETEPEDLDRDANDLPF